MTEPISSEVAELAVLLDAFPAQAGAPAGTQVPIHPKSRESWAEALWRRGVRVHLDLAEEFPLPGDQPGMGMWNPTRWVSRAEYEAAQAGGGAGGSAAAPDPQREAIAALLKLVDPNMAAQIENLDPDEALEFRTHLESQIPDAVKNLQDARSMMGAPATADAAVAESDAELVEYVRADGTSTMVTPAQAAAYEARKASQ